MECCMLIFGSAAADAVVAAAAAAAVCTGQAHPLRMTRLVLTDSLTPISSALSISARCPALWGSAPRAIR
jgi:hypothetical protein